MGTREEHLEREQAAWEAFLAVVATVPADRLDDRSVVPGWSAKDLIWHSAGWATFAAEQLEEMVDGPFADPFEGVEAAHWDKVSEAMVEEGRALTFDEVMTAAEAARASMRTVWSSLPEIDDDRARLFAEETFLHYDDHAAEIRRYLGSADLR
jgi:hypothetical protein